MHLEQLPRRFEKLIQGGVDCRFANGASEVEIDNAEIRLDVQIPGQVRQFYSACNGFQVRDPPTEVFAINELDLTAISWNSAAVIRFTAWHLTREL